MSQNNTSSDNENIENAPIHTIIPDYIYCSYEPLNPYINRVTNEEIHVCGHYGSVFCNKCPCRYDGNKIKKYMEDNPIEH